MKEKKVKMKFTDFECNLLINGINEWRNMLLAVDYPTEDVDELLLKIIKKRRASEMEKIMIDERTGWEYELIGEQYYPTGRVMRNGVLTPSEPPEDNGPGEEKPIGIWGQRHLRYIRQYKKSLYFDLFVSGKLNAYLAEINAQAEESFSRLVKEMAAQEGVNEKLKAEDQMAWVQRMNNVWERATEIVNRDLIYT